MNEKLLIDLNVIIIKKNNAIQPGKLYIIQVKEFLIK